MRLLAAGNAALWDLILRADRQPAAWEVGRLEDSPGAAGRWSPGGAALTLALAARRQGIACAVWHPLPADAAADAVTRPLERAGIDLSRAPRIVMQAARCVLVGSPGGRSAWSGESPDPGAFDPDHVLDGIAHLVVASRWGGWTDRILAAAVARGVPISLVGEAAEAGRAYAWSNVVLDQAQLALLGPLTAEAVVETRGAAGAVLHIGGASFEVPAAAARAVDATGAGDVFGGTFIAARMKGEEPRQAARRAAEAAARTCEGWGAWAGVLPVPAGARGAADRMQRVQGALAGTACGDAFGMPNSFLPRPPWRRVMTEGPPESPYHAGYPAGRITDDTEQALALTAALEDGFSAEAVARRLNDWFVSVGGEASLAVGPSTRRAMLAYQAKVPLAQIGRTGVTNGAAMRIAPVGVFAGLKSLPLDRLVDAVEIACLPTHHTGPAISGAAAIAAAVAAAVAGWRWDEIMDATVEAARAGVTRGAWVYSADVAERILHARSLTAGASSDQDVARLISDVVGAGEPTTESVPAALAIADYAGGDPARAIEISGNLRGDTDTVAAMAGAVCGAFAGLDALPAAWIETVAHVNGLNIADWAERLRRCALEGTQVASFARTELRDAARS